jgi:hypothetical protein
LHYGALKISPKQQKASEGAALQEVHELWPLLGQVVQRFAELRLRQHRMPMGQQQRLDAVDDRAARFLPQRLALLDGERLGAADPRDRGSAMGY